MDAVSSTIDEVKELVAQHTVCYEVYPDRLLVRGELRTVGYEVQLLGSHARGSTRMTPGCELCASTFRDLRRIAEWKIPPDERDSKFEIVPFDGALHMATRHGLRPEVALSVTIEHRRGFDAPLDECESRCLRDVELRLNEVGARRRN